MGRGGTDRVASLESKESRFLSMDHYKAAEDEQREKRKTHNEPETVPRAEFETNEKLTKDAEGDASKVVAGKPTEGRGVPFRSRKRARKTRLRRALDSEKNGEAEDSEGEPEMSRSELLLMREAQKLREENRKTSLDITVTKDNHLDGEKLQKHGDASGDNVMGGLKEDFAVERSGHAMEERMENYINERMRKKFGDNEEPAGASGLESKPTDENDLFAIPERLRLEERPLYDPGEGLPAAGVEEVQLPEEMRRKNVEETVRAHKKLLAKKGSRDRTQAVESLAGNLSANYMKHRNDWIAEHLGPKNTGNQNNDKVSQRGSENDSKDAQDNKKPEAGKRLRYQAATDNLIADRFKKRWRR